MDDLLPLLGLGAGTALLLYELLWRSPEARLSRGLRFTPRRRVADVKDGATVKIVGTAESLGERVIAPVSGRPCLLYEVVVRRRSAGSSGGVGAGRNLLVREVGASDFAVRDASGRAVVRAAGKLDHELLVGLRTEVMFEPAPGHVQPDGVMAYLAARGVGLYACAVFEAVIEPGQELAVVGTARLEPDPHPEPATATGGYREAPTRVVLHGSGRVPLLLSHMRDLVSAARRR